MEQLPQASRSVALDGERCKDLRVRSGLSRDRLADLSRGVDSFSAATVKRAERGRSIFLGNARRIAELLETPLEHLLRHAPVVPVYVSKQAERGGDGPPAIAVAPFDALFEATDNDYFCDGVVEDLIHRLAGRWFPVISRNSTLGAREGDGAADGTSRLNARYLVGGSVQRDGDRVRVGVHLTDTQTTERIWSHQFDCLLGDLFAAQDALTSQIVRQVDRNVVAVEYRRTQQRHPDDLEAWQIGLRGAWHFYRRNRDDNLRARDYLEQALRRDQKLGAAFYTLALTYQQEILNQWSADPRATLQTLTSVCEDFDREHPDDPWAHIAGAYPCIYTGERALAMGRLSEAIDQEPNAVAARSLYGQILAMASQPDRGLEQLAVAMQLSPKDPDFWMFELATALAHFAAERYGDSVEWAERATITNPQAGFAHGALAAALAQSGDLERGRGALMRMREYAPNASAQGFGLVIASTDPDISARYVAGLRKVGLPA